MIINTNPIYYFTTNRLRLKVCIRSICINLIVNVIRLGEMEKRKKNETSNITRTTLWFLKFELTVCLAVESPLELLSTFKWMDGKWIHFMPLILFWKHQHSQRQRCLHTIRMEQQTDFPTTAYWITCEYWAQSEIQVTRAPEANTPDCILKVTFFCSFVTFSRFGVFFLFVPFQWRETMIWTNVELLEIADYAINSTGCRDLHLQQGKTNSVTKCFIGYSI